MCVQENEKSRDIVIEQRLHRLIIGSQGSRIREIREHFPTVSIFIPDLTRKSDVITLRGPRSDVDKCYSYLQKLCRDLVRLALFVPEIYSFICDPFVYHISERCLGLYAVAK